MVNLHSDLREPTFSNYNPKVSKSIRELERVWSNLHRHIHHLLETCCEPSNLIATSTGYLTVFETLLEHVECPVPETLLWYVWWSGFAKPYERLVKGFWHLLPESIEFLESVSIMVRKLKSSKPDYSTVFGAWEQILKDYEARLQEYPWLMLAQCYRSKFCNQPSHPSEVDDFVIQQLRGFDSLFYAYGSLFGGYTPDDIADWEKIKNGCGDDLQNLGKKNEVELFALGFIAVSVMFDHGHAFIDELYYKSCAEISVSVMTAILEQWSDPKFSLGILAVFIGVWHIYKQLPQKAQQLPLAAMCNVANFLSPRAFAKTQEELPIKPAQLTADHTEIIVCMFSGTVFEDFPGNEPMKQGIVAGFPIWIAQIVRNLLVSCCAVDGFPIAMDEIGKFYILQNLPD